jgi:hypothetical protein
MQSPKPKPCKACRQPFNPLRSFAKACSTACALQLVEESKAKKAAKELRMDRQATRKALERLKTRSAWFMECKTLAQRYSRLRDRLAGHGCISCGAYPEQRRGGTMDGGHYRSVGSARHLALLLTNLAAQCVRCNRDLGGAYSEYRKGLIARRGLAFVELLEADQEPRKYSADYLKRYKAVIGKRARRMEKRLADCKDEDGA